MGGQKKLNLPDAPAPYNYPGLTGNINDQYALGKQLEQGQFGQGQGGDLSWLQSLVNPNFSQQAIQGAQAQLQPQYDQNNLDIKNQAAANNSLNSSTFTDALAKNAYNLNSTLQGVGLQQGINDAYSANSNKLNLFGLGLNQAQQGIGNQSQSEQLQNQYQQQQYENQVAAALAEQQNSKGGFSGALTGALGGALSGFAATGNPIGAAIGGIGGGFAGGFSPAASNTGGSIFAGGAGLLGSKLGGFQNIFGSGLGSAGALGGGALPGSSAFTPLARGVSNGGLQDIYSSFLRQY